MYVLCYGLIFLQCYLKTSHKPSVSLDDSSSSVLGTMNCRLHGSTHMGGYPDNSSTCTFTRVRGISLILLKGLYSNMNYLTLLTVMFLMSPDMWCILSSTCIVQQLPWCNRCVSRRILLFCLHTH